MLWVCLEHFISPMRAVHGKQSNGVKRRESIFKKFKTKWEDIFFWSSFPVCWHELKAHCPCKKRKKKGKFTDKEKKKKAREVPQASGRSKCLANRWSYCSSLWDFLNPSQKKKEKQNGVEADTSMTLLLCWKAPWSLTFGGLSTSSEVERLVPSSHATAEEEETVLASVRIRVNTTMSWLHVFSVHHAFHQEIPVRWWNLFQGRPGWESSSKTNIKAANKQQTSISIKKNTKVYKICRSLATWNVKHKVCSPVIFTDTLEIIQHPPKNSKLQWSGTEGEGLSNGSIYFKEHQTWFDPGVIPFDVQMNQL